MFTLERAFGNTYDTFIVFMGNLHFQVCKHQFGHVDDVPDQIGTLSQVGTKKISKGGWSI